MESNKIKYFILSILIFLTFFDCKGDDKQKIERLPEPYYLEPDSGWCFAYIVK